MAELGSFVKAADLLGVAQPTLSRQIRALEIELKASFFHRNGRGVLLTPTGSRFLEQARSVLQAADAATEVVRRGDRRLTGKIACGMTPSVGTMMIPEYVRRFSKALPYATLSIVSHLSTTLHDQLRASRLDFAIFHNPPVTQNLRTTPLSAEPLYLVGARQVGANKATVRFLDIDGVPLVLPSRLHAIRNPFELEAARLGVSLNVALEVDLMESLLEIASDAQFHVISTRFGLRGKRRGTELFAQRIVEPELFTQVALVSPLPSALTPLQHAAIELAVSTYGDLIARVSTNGGRAKGRARTPSWSPGNPRNPGNPVA